MHGPKIGEGLCPFWGRELATHKNNVVRAHAYLHTKWHLNPTSRLAPTDMGQKLGTVPILGKGSWVTIKHNVPWADALPPFQVSS